MVCELRLCIHGDKIAMPFACATGGSLLHAYQILIPSFQHTPVTHTHTHTHTHARTHTQLLSPSPLLDCRLFLSDHKALLPAVARARACQDTHIQFYHAAPTFTSSHHGGPISSAATHVPQRGVAVIDGLPRTPAFQLELGRSSVPQLFQK